MGIHFLLETFKGTFFQHFSTLNATFLKFCFYLILKKNIISEIKKINKYMHSAINYIEQANILVYHRAII